VAKHTKNFTTHGERAEPISPIVFDNPHSGRELPDHFSYDCPEEELMAFGDLHIEKLLRDIPDYGIPVLEARIHRAVIDLNRRENNNHSLIPGRLGQPFPLTSIFNHHSRPTVTEVEKRINLYHRPYYKKLRELLNDAHKQFGFCIHMDMHSIRRVPNLRRADIIIGNLNGTSCNDILNKFMSDFFEDEGLSVGFNNPYKGAALIEGTYNTSDCRNSLQIEIARDLYMDDDTLEFDEIKGSQLRDTMPRFARDLHDFSLDHAAELTQGISNTPSQDDSSASSSSPKPT